jgi:phosphohistidine phosphatase
VCEALYSGGVLALLEQIRLEHPTTGILLVVGHEPTWSQAASLLVGGGRLRLPTAALIRIDLEVDRWSDIHAGTGQLSWLVSPRLFPSDTFEFAN